MFEEFLVSPEMAFGLVLSFLGVIFGFVKRENIGVAAKAIGSSALTKQVLRYLKSEFSDDVDALLDSTKLPYVMSLAKMDEEKLKAICEFESKADLDSVKSPYLIELSRKNPVILEAFIRLSKATNVVELEKATTFYREQMERIVYSGGIMPDEMEKALTAHMHDALNISKKE